MLLAGVEKPCEQVNRRQLGQSEGQYSGGECEDGIEDCTLQLMYGEHSCVSSVAVGYRQSRHDCGCIREELDAFVVSLVLVGIRADRRTENRRHTEAATRR